MIETQNADNETGNADHETGNSDYETRNSDHETGNSDHETGNSNDNESRLKSKFLASIENTQQESDDEEEIFILSWFNFIIAFIVSTKVIKLTKDKYFKVSSIYQFL